MAPATTAQPPEHLLPIDIHYAKFLHWLVDRRRVSAKWALHLNAARTLARNALANTPPEIISRLNIPHLPPHRNLPYFQLHSFFNALLSATPPLVPTDKDLLGRYKSPVLRPWADALSAFQTAHLYLADAAQHLVHNTNNEALAINNTIARLNRDIANYARRQQHSVRAAEDARQRFHLALHQYDLRDEPPFNFEAQLLHYLQHHVPRVLQHAVHATADPHFDAALRYYHTFAEYVATPPLQPPVCDMVQRVMKADVHHLITPVQPNPTPSTTPDIDWSAMFTVQSDNQHHQPAPTDTPHHAQPPVDWAIHVTESGTADASPPVASEHAAAEIESQPHPDQHHQVHPHPGAPTSNLQPDQPLTLTDAQVRETYLNQLLELHAFLAQREKQLSQLTNSPLSIVLQQANSVPTAVNTVDHHALAQMTNAVTAAIHAINGAHTRHLLALQTNPKLLQRTAKAVLQKKHAAQRTSDAILVLEQQRDAAAAQLADENAKMQRLAQQTMHLKTHTEKELSTLYGGRQVNIVGDINVVFSSRTASTS